MLHHLVFRSWSKSEAAKANLHVSDLLQRSQAPGEEVSDMKEASFNSQGLEQIFENFDSQGLAHNSNGWQTVHRGS
eukprot:6681244-Karenia_brevis.AAC.1